MSATLAAVRRKVRYLLNDLDQARPVFTDPAINAALSSQRVIVAGETYMPHAWSAADFTTSAATDTYALSGSNQVEQVLGIVNASDGQEIILLSRAEFQRMRDGLAVPADSASRPVWGTLIESVATVVSVQLHPWPDAAYSYNVLRAVLTADPVHTDATSIVFDAHGIEALVARAAALLAGRSSAEVLAKLGLSPSVPGVFLAQAALSEGHSRVRRRRLSATGQTARTRRW